MDEIRTNPISTTNNREHRSAKRGSPARLFVSFHLVLSHHHAPVTARKEETITLDRNSQFYVSGVTHSRHGITDVTSPLAFGREAVTVTAQHVTLAHAFTQSQSVQNVKTRDGRPVFLSRLLAL